MAYRITKNINPLDLKPSIAVGVKLPFNGSAVFVSTYTTKDAVKSNIINYFLTDKGERVFKPSFGSGIKSKIFEMINIDNTENLRETVIDGLNDNFPYIKIEDLNIQTFPDQNLINISLNYSIINSGQKDNLNLLFQNN